MIRRRLLLVERSLQGGAAELQETEMPSLALLPFVTAPSSDSSAAKNDTNAVRGVEAPAGMGGFGCDTQSASARRPPLASHSSSPASGSAGSAASAAASAMRAPAQDLGGNSAAAAVAERIWGVVDEGNRTVLLGRLFELSSHPDCFLGVTDARFVRGHSPYRFSHLASAARLCCTPPKPSHDGLCCCCGCRGWRRRSRLICTSWCARGSAMRRSGGWWTACTARTRSSESRAAPGGCFRGGCEARE